MRFLLDNLSRCCKFELIKTKPKQTMPMSTEGQPSKVKRNLNINVGKFNPKISVQPPVQTLKVQPFLQQSNLNQAVRNEELMKLLTEIADPELVCENDSKKEHSDPKSSTRRPHPSSLSHFSSIPNAAMNALNYKEPQSMNLLNLGLVINQFGSKQNSDKNNF